MRDVCLVVKHVTPENSAPLNVLTHRLLRVRRDGCNFFPFSHFPIFVRRRWQCRQRSQK
jgi:hypothetical protein